MCGKTNKTKSKGVLVPFLEGGLWAGSLGRTGVGATG